MIRMCLHRKGQSTMEYAILIIIIIGALLAVQVYIKRGIQGKMKSSADDIGQQYSPDNTKIVKQTVQKSQVRELLGGEGKQGQASTVIQGNDINTVRETAQIINTEREQWKIRE